MPDNDAKLRRFLCFKASLLVSKARQIGYVEGYALSVNATLALRHAWCVDAAGGIVDCTWHPAGLAYFGIPIDENFVEHGICERKGLNLRPREYSLLYEYWEQDCEK